MNFWKLKRYKYALKMLWQSFWFKVKIFVRKFHHTTI